MQARWVLVFSVLCVAFPKVSSAQYYADRGAVVGGLTGALAGAGIGKHNDETAAGALIGGAVGLVTGSVIGNSMDNKAQREAAAYRYVQQRQVRQVQRAVSPYDVIRMSQSGVGEEVMINQIRQYGVQQSLEVQDVIALHRQGVPESVIAAMQQAGDGPAPEPIYVEQRRPPVVVQEYYVAPAPVPYYYHPRPVYHHHHYGPSPYHCAPPRSSVSWGVTVRN